MKDEKSKVFIERMKNHNLKNVSSETQNKYLDNLDRKVELIKRKYQEVRELIVSEKIANISDEEINRLVHKELTSNKSMSELQEAFRRIDEETEIVDELKKEQRENIEER